MPQNKQKNVTVPHQEEGVVATSTPVDHKIALTPAQLSREDLVRYKLNNEDDWIRAKLIDRAGKRGGKNENWWNVKNLSTGHRFSVDTGNAQVIERLDEDTPESEKRSAEMPKKGNYDRGMISKCRKKWKTKVSSS